MDIDPFNFADALLGILAQRLVRTLCKDCKEEYAPTQEEFAELMEEYGLEYWDTLGITYSPDFKLYRPKGCAKCGNTGYKGRMGIHELLVATDEMKRKIQKREPDRGAAQAGHARRHDHAAPGRHPEGRRRASRTSSRSARSA